MTKKNLPFSRGKHKGANKNGEKYMEAIKGRNISVAGLQKCHKCFIPIKACESSPKEFLFTSTLDYKTL